MADWGKWSPLKIPDVWRASTDKADDSGDPLNSWDASDWDDPDGGTGWKDRLTPNHAGQWLILGAVLSMFMGGVFWIGNFIPLTNRNPWTISISLHIALPLIAYVVGREHGFLQNRALDWAFITTGRSVTVLPGMFIERFGQGDIKHIKYTPLKSRTYGAFGFNFLKLADLEADRENLMSKATNTNRGPDDFAHFLLPGTLTGENTDTVLGRVFGVHGSEPSYHDSGQETDMRIKPPSTLDDDIAGDVLSKLELYDTRIIPELKDEIRTVVTQKNRYKQRAEAERDPELDRLLSSVDTMANIIRSDGRSGNGNSSDSESDTDEISKRAREHVENNKR